MSEAGSVIEVTNKCGTCTGLITELEKTLRELPVGTRVSAVAPDVPTRVDVLAWAGRKGHRIISDQREGFASRLVIEKVALSPFPSSTGSR